MDIFCEYQALHFLQVTLHHLVLFLYLENKFLRTFFNSRPINHTRVLSNAVRQPSQHFATLLGLFFSTLFYLLIFEAKELTTTE